MTTGRGKGSSPSARSWERSVTRSAALLTIPSAGLERRTETTRQTDLGKTSSLIVMLPLVLIQRNKRVQPMETVLLKIIFHSDNEERSRSSQNGKSGKEFKDEEETVTTKSVQIVQATETTATRKRGGVPSRKVDLGAAAQYTGDQSPASVTKQVPLGRKEPR